MPGPKKNKTIAKKPIAKKPVAKKPIAKKPVAKKPVAKKPVAKKPVAKKPVAKKPAATTAAKKPATNKASASSVGGGVLRGLPLVEKALAELKNGSPRDPQDVERMTLGGRPLTPALKRWLLADDLDLGEPQSFNEMIENEFADYMVEAFAPVAEVLTEPVVLLETGSDSRRFIYLGKTDSHGELPVFTIDTDDTPYVCLNGPTDVWLAVGEGEHYGALAEEYEPARREHAKLNFGGNVEFAENQFNKTISG